jgi:hypothetical protein
MTNIADFVASQGWIMGVIWVSRRWWLLGLFGFGLTACNMSPTQVFSGLDPTPTVTINSVAQSQDGASIVVAGRVGTIAPLVGKVAYEVLDHTGAVWVVTKRRPPQPNSQVKVHGLVRTMDGERYLDQK